MALILESGNLKLAVLEKGCSFWKHVFPPISNISLPRHKDQSGCYTGLLHPNKQVPRYCQWLCRCQTGRQVELFPIGNICILFHQEGLFQHNIGQLCTPDGSDSSGFSEKAASSEVSCSDYCRGRAHETGLDCGLPPPYSAKVCLAGYNDRNIREQSGKVFPSDVQIMAGKAGCVNPALTECPYSTLPRWT